MVLYVICLVILYIYATIVEENTPEKYLGWVTASAVITSDIILVMFSFVQNDQGPT